MANEYSEKSLGLYLLRDMISKDFGAVTNRSDEVKVICTKLEECLSVEKVDVNNVLNEVEKKVLDKTSRKAGTLTKIEGLFGNIKMYIDSIQGLYIFYAICKVSIPLTQEFLDKTTGSDAEDKARFIAKRHLEKDGDSAIDSIFDDWDSFTYKARFDLIGELSGKFYLDVMKELKNLQFKISNETIDSLITQTIFELQRRLRQQGVQQVGKHVESAARAILEHVGWPPLHDKPMHITALTEADHIVEKNGWYVVFSCKRTARERIKQADQSEETNRQFQIRKIVHFIPQADITVNRVENLGNNGALFFLPSKSAKYKELISVSNTAKYVLPLSDIREILPKIIGRGFEEWNANRVKELFN